MKVRFSPQAQKELHAAVSYLADKNLLAAARLGRRLLMAIDRIADGEFDGPRSQLKSGRWVQSWPVQPYRIYYRRQPETLEIVRVYHQSRRPIVR